VTSIFNRQMRVFHRLRARPSLLTGLAVAATSAAALLPVLPDSRSPLIAWNLGAIAYLARLAASMLGATPETMRRRAAILDEGNWTIFALTVGAAGAALAAILVDLAASKGEPGQAARAVLAAATVLVSWTFVHTVFAQHYAHLWFLRMGGLDFPDTPEPDIWDCVYFSFVIGMTFQVSDVQVTSREMRRLVLVHGLVSFLFNTVILALSVNLAAGLA
jgi:uncharacterized membrane protein